MDIILQLISALVTGNGIIAAIIVLLLVIAFILQDRKRLLSTIQQKEELIEQKNAKIEKIVDDYYKGNITITEALNGLKLVLVEIKGKL